MTTMVTTAVVTRKTIDSAQAESFISCSPMFSLALQCIGIPVIENKAGTMLFVVPG